ncbi:MAG: hypothetical protein AB7W37_03670 [Syntrophobacteraceae bacterium]
MAFDDFTVLSSPMQTAGTSIIAIPDSTNLNVSVILPICPSTSILYDFGWQPSILAKKSKQTPPYHIFTTRAATPHNRNHIAEPEKGRFIRRRKERTEMRYPCSRYIGLIQGIFRQIIAHKIQIKNLYWAGIARWLFSKAPDFFEQSSS